MPDGSGVLLEEAVEEPTNEVVIGTRRVAGFFLSPTRLADAGEGTVNLQAPVIPARLAETTGLPALPAGHDTALDPVFSLAAPEAPTRVRDYARPTGAYEPPTRLLRSSARKEARPRRRPTLTALTPRALIVEPWTVSFMDEGKVPPRDAGGSGVRTAPRLIPPRSRLALASATASCGQAERPGKQASVATDVASRFRGCMRQLLTTMPLARTLTRISWSKHRNKVAIALGALPVLALLLLPGSQARGRIEVISSPPGARITLNGQRVPQTTPALIEVDLDRDQQVVEVSLSDYQPWHKIVTVSSRKPRVELRAELEPTEDHVEVEPLATFDSLAH